MIIKIGNGNITNDKKMILGKWSPFYNELIKPRKGVCWSDIFAVVFYALLNNKILKNIVNVWLFCYCVSFLTSLIYYLWRRTSWECHTRCWSCQFLKHVAEGLRRKLNHRQYFLFKTTLCTWQFPVDTEVNQPNYRADHSLFHLYFLLFPSLKPILVMQTFTG